MNAPQDFVEKLERKFDGRLRIRWSPRAQRFVIEQKVGRMTPPPVRIDEGRDDLIQARDGYLGVMEITPGDRMPCPRCHYTLQVPVFETWDMRCPYCRLMGYQTRVVAGYWPLNDRLIEHLQKIDPLRGLQAEQAAAADRHNRLLLESQTNDALRPGEAKFEQDYNRLVGIAQNTNPKEGVLTD